MPTSIDLRLDSQHDAAVAQVVLEAYFEARALHGQPDFGRWYRQRIDQAAKSVRPFALPLAGVEVLLAAGTATRRSMVLFDGLRFEHLIQRLARNTRVAVIVRKPQDVVRVAASGARVVPAWSWYEDLARALNDPKHAGVPLTRLLARAQRAITSTRATCLIATNDSLPFERLLIAAARTTGIPSIAVQHGFFSDTTPLALLDGHYGDHFLTWGPDLRERYVAADERYATRVHTFGYPYPVSREAPLQPDHRRTALLVVGKPVAAYAAEGFDRYVEQVRAVVRGGLAAGFTVTYRRHPVEDEQVARTLAHAFPEVDFRGNASSTETSIARSTAVAAWGSTMLIEAALSGRRTFDVNADANRSALARAGFAIAIPPDADAFAAALRQGRSGPSPELEQRRARSIRLLPNMEASFLETIRNLVDHHASTSASSGTPT